MLVHACNLSSICALKRELPIEHRRIYLPIGREDYDSLHNITHKNLYDLAVSQPERPIYLADDQLGPTYIHALWYATVEGRSTSEFVHLLLGEKPAPGSLILSSEPDCQNCDLLLKEETGVLYRSRPERGP